MQTPRPHNAEPRRPGVGFSFLLAAAILVLGPRAVAQNTGANRSIEPRHLIDVPTAGMLRGGMTSFQADFFHEDGLTASFGYGIFDRLMVGISFGATHMIGTEAPDWNEVPGFLARFRVVEESEGFPALTIGFESQGGEGFVDDLDRFKIKSPGAFLVGSKNFDASGYLGFHGGVNYSFEHGDGDKDINFSGGLDKSIGGFMSLVAEYNFAFNDNSAQAVGRGRGYLNAGLSFFPGAGVVISINFKDLLENQAHEGFANRTIRLELAK